MSPGLHGRLPSEDRHRVVENLLAQLHVCNWFDERVVSAITATHRFRSTLPEKMALPQHVLLDEIITELKVHAYCAPTLPVGFRLTEAGRELGRRQLAGIPAAEAESLTFEVATIYVGLVRRGGGRRARRALVEAARHARREDAEGLVSAAVYCALTFAAHGHPDLLPVVLNVLFGTDDDRIPPLAEARLRAVAVAEERDWHGVAQLLQGITDDSRLPSPAPPLEPPSSHQAVVSTRQLLTAGVHFGSTTRRWNPKMRKFVFSQRNGVLIIDLLQTLRRLEEAYTFVRDTVSAGGTVLFVGTKPQATESIQTSALRCGMPYVNRRWLGGMLTNFATIARQIDKMHRYQAITRSADLGYLPKREVVVLRRRLSKIERGLLGASTMTRCPDAIFLIDPRAEHLAVAEARRLGIPVAALIDTDGDPDSISFPIPGNDDSITATSLICRVIADAVLEGRFIAEHRADARIAEPARGDVQTERGARRAAATSDLDPMVYGDVDDEPDEA